MQQRRGYAAFPSLVAALLGLSACGGSQAPAQVPEERTTVEPPAESTSAPVESPGADEADGSAEKSAGKPGEAVAEPEFTDNMSVDQAIKAVPQGTPRQNIEQEALAKPLQDPATFETCKPGNARFKLRVAVWNGKAVGVDVTTTPKQQKLADCLAGRVRELSWPDKVKSLNTVEYQY